MSTRNRINGLLIHGSPEWKAKRDFQATEFRRLVPDAFDASGRMFTGQLPRVLEAYAAAHPKKALV